MASGLWWCTHEDESKRANIAALSIMIAIYLYTAVMSFVQPVPL
jgi:hypothetical protein